MYGIVYAATRKAGLEQKVSPHWMRHAHASHALDRSAPIHLVQATLGHASVSTTGPYLHAQAVQFLSAGISPAALTLPAGCHGFGHIGSPLRLHAVARCGSLPERFRSFPRRR